MWWSRAFPWRFQCSTTKLYNVHLFPLTGILPLYIYITYIFTYYNAPSFPLALFSRTPRFTIFPSIYLSIYHHHHHHHPAIFSTGPWSNPPPHNFIFLVLALTQFSFTLFFQHVYCFILYFIISHFMFLFFVNSYI